METVLFDRQAVIDGMDAGHRAACAAQRQMLRHVHEWDVHEVWKRDGCRNMAQWLSGRYGISVSQGHRWTDAAHALEYLPHIASAFESAELCLDKVCQLARFARPETDNELARWARTVSVNAIRRRADLASRVDLEETKKIDEARYLRGWYEGDSIFWLEGMLPAEQGALVTKALERVAEILPEWPQGTSTREMRHADALVALATSSISDASDADRATVIVHSDLAALATDDGECEIDGATVLHPEVARRLSCDARVQIVRHDARGRTVGIGRMSRTVPHWLLRELKRRDDGCTFPGCGTTRFLHAHHIVHWSQGGPTDLDNLTLVCGFHHRLVHEHRWTVQLGADDLAVWRRPNRLRYHPALAGVP